MLKLIEITKKVHPFSVLFLITYISVVIAMDDLFFHQEQILVSLVVIISVLLMQESLWLLFVKENKLSVSDIFVRDFVCVFYNFMFAVFISMLFQYKNSDMRGWWGLVMLVNIVYATVFSLMFALFAKLLKEHKGYLVLFSILVLLVFSLSKFWYLALYKYNLNNYFIVYAGLLFLHLLVCLGTYFKSNNL